MASFNGMMHIREQVNSVLVQLRPHDELVVSDNGSTDGTLQVLENVQDPRLRLVHCETKGVTSNFENALRSATGEILILCDQDDVWLPGRLEAAIRGLQYGDLSVVGCMPVNARLEPIACTMPTPSPSLLGTLLKNGYVGCLIAFRRDILSAVLPFPGSLPMHDWWIALVGLSLGRVSVDYNPYVLYRRHQHNVSQTGGTSEVPVGRRIAWRVRLALALVVRLARYRCSPRARTDRPA